MIRKTSLLSGSVAAALAAAVVVAPSSVTTAHAAPLNSSVQIAQAAAGQPAGKPDYSSQLALMKSISYSITSDGSAPTDSYVYGMNRDKEDLYGSYREARERSVQQHIEAGATRNIPQMSSWADCGGYLATVLKNTVDPHFPWVNTNAQKEYLADPANGWVKVGDTNNYRPQDYKPGDVMTSDGHNMFWVGNWNGFTEVVNDAALSRDTATRSGRMPSFHEAGFRQSPSQSAGKNVVVDWSKKVYDVYRYEGRVASNVGTTEWAIASKGMIFDGKPDLMAIDADGSLNMHRGQGDGGAFGATARVGGTDYTDYQVVTPGDFNMDGAQDIIQMKNSTGVIYLRRGTGYGGIQQAEKIGEGFKNIRDLMSVGDFSGDGHPDLIGNDETNGRMYMWPGNGKGGLLARKQIGTGFQSLKVASAGDYDGDGRSDIVSWNDDTGLMYLHRGNGKGSWLSRVTLAQSGKGHANVDITSVGDHDQDGYGDLIVLDKSSGKLLMHEGNSAAKLGSAKVIDSNMKSVRGLS